MIEKQKIIADSSACIAASTLLSAGHFKAKITRWVSAWIYSHEEDFDEAEVSSFDEALEMCKAVGSLGGLIGQGVEFTNIDKENMTAEFKVNGRMSYAGDSFSLSVAPCT